MPRAASLGLWIVGALAISRPYELHYISSYKSEYKDTAANITELAAILLDSMGAGPPAAEYSLVRHQLNAIVNNPVDPVKAFWIVYIAGMDGCSQTLWDSDGLQKTVFKCSVTGGNATVNLEEQLMIGNKTRMSALFTTSMTEDSLVMFHSTDARILLSLSPATFPVAKLDNAYYSGTRPLVARLREARTIAAVPIKVQKQFDLSDDDVFEGSEGFFAELQQLASTLDYLETAGKDVTGRESLSAPRHDVLVFGLMGMQNLASKFGRGSEQYARARHLLITRVLPKLMSRFYGLYNDRSLGTVVFLDDVVFGPEILGSRWTRLMQTFARNSDAVPPFCYSSYDECVRETNQCRGNGVCEGFTFVDNNHTESSCWQCQCYYGYDGPVCQYEDASVPFWSAVAVLWILGLTVGGAMCLVCWAGNNQVVAAGLQLHRQ